jgi:NAD(P)-dependent dehydrogenase (short-subunit alcohol dehydrogenase family)
MSDVTFDNKVAIVTGAGGGLGRSHALLFAERGARVVVNDLGGTVHGEGADVSAADAVVKEIEAAGGTAVANYDSVATAEGGAAIVQTALDAFGQVDVVVNNAGILRDQSFAKMTPENIDAVIDVHVKGAFHVSRPAFAAMKEQGFGRFVHTASAAGLFGNFGQANYGAAKMALVGFSGVLANEGLKYNITSNVIAPIAKTRMTEELMGAMAEGLLPEYVSSFVVYLCSPTCELSHEVFSVARGRVARVFVGLGPGWMAPLDGGVPTPEDYAAHIDAIRATDPYIIPFSAAEEVQSAMEIFNQG